VSATPILEARGLLVERAGARVLDVPSFPLEEGEIVALIGPNGSGKSTLLLALMTLLPREAGQVLWRGSPVASGREAIACRRRMALVLQEPHLFRETVYENVAAGLRIRGVGRAEERARVAAALARFGIAPLARRPALELSGGEARRVSLARALAAAPEVVLLDEPFSNLDAPARQAISADLERTLRESGTAAVLVTHSQDEALRLSDRIAVMEAGRIVQSDPPALVTNEPVNEFVASCVGMETIAEGVVARGGGGEIVMAVGGHEIDAIAEAAPGERVWCCIRPEHVTLDLMAPEGATSARNVLPARVVGLSPAGAFLKVKLDCGFPLVATVTPRSVAVLGLAPGREVFASFKATAVHVIQRSEPGRPGVRAPRAG
jgi:tungstate transport system ATP-binding protein